MSESLFAVIGQPIAHSRSPRIHSEFARECGIALRYEAIEVGADELAERLSALHKQGYRGLNVTLPHKAAVAALCESVSERAQRAGAVNCLIRTESGWRGDNTDGEGLLRDLRRLHFDVHERRVLVLGAGGAARGIIEPLLSAGPSRLVVSNRNPWKPEALAEQFKAMGTIEPRTHIALKGDRFDLVINATSAGHSGSLPRFPVGLFAENAAFYDLSYGAAAKPFAQWALADGAQRVADGFGMLVEQAAISFALWLGREPETQNVLTQLQSEAY